MTTARSSVHQRTAVLAVSTHGDIHAATLTGRQELPTVRTVRGSTRSTLANQSRPPRGGDARRLPGGECKVALALDPRDALGRPLHHDPVQAAREGVDDGGRRRDCQSCQRLRRVLQTEDVAAGGQVARRRDGDRIRVGHGVDRPEGDRGAVYSGAVCVEQLDLADSVVQDSGAGSSTSPTGTCCCW